MKTVHIGLDEKLLRATDQAARRTKQNRSELVRAALGEHLRRLEVRALEKRDRAGYLRMPQQRDEFRVWEAEASFPLGCDLSHP
jgi:metal-responsive CopG/Arc/MetJ family transcriptional regulator